MGVSLRFLFVAFASSCLVADSCSQDVQPLLDALFANLGHDCTTYFSLFSDNAQYYHQHDGHKNYSQLLANCQGYAKFCPDGKCKFQQNGDAMVKAGAYLGPCNILVPYLWSETPANSKGLEPHTGWEYIVAVPAMGSKFGYKMEYFAEIETSYSVAFNWAKPDDTPAVVKDSTLYLLGLSNSASKGECNNPIAPGLTKYFEDKSAGNGLWRQQGDAVVLAAGGICHVTAPYAAEVDGVLKSGYSVFTFQPAGKSYLIKKVVDFPFSSPSREVVV